MDYFHSVLLAMSKTLLTNLCQVLLTFICRLNLCFANITTQHCIQLRLSRLHIRESRDFRTNYFKGISRVYWVGRVMQTCSLAMPVPVPACPHRAFELELFSTVRLKTGNRPSKYSIPVTVNLTTATSLSNGFEEIEARPRSFKSGLGSRLKSVSEQAANSAGVVKKV